jgi:hypothetical protein
MADNLELNVEALSKTLRKQASGFRQLAGESLEGAFKVACSNSLWITTARRKT